MRGHVEDTFAKGAPKFKLEDVTINDLHKLSNDSFALWCLTSGVAPDGNEFDFERHRYLIPIYMDMGKKIVVRKAAQTGLSIWGMLRTLYWLEKNQGRKAGYFLPTQELCQGMSKDRLTPLMRSCASIKEIMDDNDKLNLKKVGDSSLYFSHIGGKASIDSVPMDYLLFDEVRLMETRLIDQARHRISHSPYKYETYVSTVGVEGDNIDRYYLQGSQSTWVSRCGCSDGCNLAETFPECVVYDDPKRPDDFYFRCPKCKYEIVDPQNGYYLTKNPDADFNSYHFSQLISKYRDLKDIWNEYTTTTNMTEFYNATLGLPYVDSNLVGVTMDQMESCINPELDWGPPEHGETAMGIDQGHNYIVLTIASYNKDKTKKILRHVEVVELFNKHYSQFNDPYERADELMKEYNVGVCITDAMPNYSSALQFAQRHPRKVFLGFYSEGQKEIVQWLDRNRAKEGVRKAGPLLKFKYTASIGRFPALSYSLGEWGEGNWQMPHPDILKQFMIGEKTGRVEGESPARRFMDHQTRLYKDYKESNNESGNMTGKWRWLYRRGDPHLSHAMNYTNIALERLRKKVSFVFA